jgi:hypothetical protein
MAPDVDQVRQPHRADVAGTVGIFNAVVVGIAGLYAGTGSLWLTAATGVIATVLAGTHLITFVGDLVVALDAFRILLRLCRGGGRHAGCHAVVAVEGCQGTVGTGSVASFVKSKMSIFSGRAGFAFARGRAWRDRTSDV